MSITMDLAERSYEITVERGCLEKAGTIFDLDRRCALITDEGVPPEYIEKISGQCGKCRIMTVPQGESSKSMTMLESILNGMMESGFTRNDCVLAVGGGMAGDLAGFAAATYMRGIDFYNIPTTLLSQADSSIGGKTAVNLRGTKNIVGAFWQPRGVLIDPDTLDSLPARHMAAGFAEIIKAGLIADAGLFSHIEQSGPEGADITAVIEAALNVKKNVVEKDERESGLRRILNFGHTIGHGIEAVTELLHGECVAIGMIPMCSEGVRKRLTGVLESMGLPVSVECDPDAVLEAVMHDKKIRDGQIMAVYVPEPGTAEITGLSPEELKRMINSICQTERHYR